MKRSLKQTAGFTLVELIVVIAILGILTAIAVPTYSGYMKKANMAADMALLDSVNTAFTAACLENGLDAKSVTASDIYVEDGEAGDLVVTDPDDKADDIEDAFGRYYQGGEFKVFDYLEYNKTLGMFEGGIIGDDLLSAAYNNGMLLISKRDKALFLNSSLGAMGADTLMYEMDNVIAYATNHLGLLTNVKNEEAFKDLCRLFDPNYDGENDTAVEMQALVLYTANQYKNLNADDILKGIKDNNGAYMPLYGTDDGKNFAANAAMYSLGLVYAKSLEETDSQGVIADLSERLGEPFDMSNVDHVQALMAYRPQDKHPVTGQPIENSYGSNTFVSWLESDKAAAKDNLDGFGGAMGMLYGNKDILDKDALLNGGGYGNADLVDALLSILNPE